MAAPVERKVKASTVAAGAAALLVWALGTYVFHGAVPEPVQAAVIAVVPALVTLAAGYLAKHTARPEDSR